MSGHLTLPAPNPAPARRPRADDGWDADVPRGVLAIGSAEPGRYGAEAATDFLAELGRLVATATSLHWARTPAPA